MLEYFSSQQTPSRDLWFTDKEHFFAKGNEDTHAVRVDVFWKITYHAQKSFAVSDSGQKELARSSL